MSDKMKLSRFNVTSRIPGTDKVVIYNSATGSIACFTEEAYDKLQKALLNNTCGCECACDESGDGGGYSCGSDCYMCD